jgi:TRAP-type mannitol/chloroaromatic compound transport system permease small subunit
MTGIIRAIQALSTLVGYIGAWVMAPLVVSMVYEVVSRHLLDAPTYWAYEAGYMMAGTCYMFGMAYCLRVGGHIRVDFIYDQLGAKGQAVIDMLGYLILMLPCCIWVTWGLYEYAMEAYVSQEQSGESAWNPLIWPFRTVWVIGFLALTLQGVAELMKAGRRFAGLPNPDDEVGNEMEQPA